MAKIPKSGIANAQTIQASHITNIIEALDGTGSYEIDATGSFTGSFTGVSSGSFSGSFEGDGTNITGVTAEWDGTHVGNAEITGSLNVSETVYIGNTAQPPTVASLYIRQPSASSSSESPIIDIQVEDANSYFRINNATATDGVFTPTIATKQSDAPDRISFYIDSVVDPTYDTPGAADVMRFRARRDSDLIQNRDLYAWYNYTSRLMSMDAAGNLNIVAGVTASSYTGSFVGDGSGLTGITDNTFANTNLTLDANRLHDLDGRYVVIGDGTAGPSQGFIYLDDNAGGGAMNIGVGLNYFAADSDESSILYGGQNRFNVFASETVVNEQGANVDFRVEGDTDVNALFVDASTDRAIRRPAERVLPGSRADAWR
jgi:hypothetical protein